MRDDRDGHFQCATANEVVSGGFVAGLHCAGWAARMRGMRANTLVYVFLMSACVAGGLHSAKTGAPFSLIVFGLAGYAVLWLAIASRRPPA